MKIDRVAIAGAGAWGTALANAAARAGRKVTLVARSEKSAKAIAHAAGKSAVARESALKTASSDGRSVSVRRCGRDLMAVPAQSLRDAVVDAADAEG